MLETQFEDFLINQKNIKSKKKAVQTRLSKARAVEKHFQTSLDFIVQDDDKMCDTLEKINLTMANSSGSYSNALRQYYDFKNKKTFPHIRDYRSGWYKFMNHFASPNNQ